MLILILPLTHLFLARAGYLLLAANDIILKAPRPKSPDPAKKELPPSEIQKQPKVFDDRAIISAPAYDELKKDALITGWLYTAKNGRQWNVVAGYNETDHILSFIKGPWAGGHWGHEASYECLEPSRALRDLFPEWCHIPQKAKETIIRFLKEKH